MSGARLCVLGGTGDLGRVFVAQALSAGYDVHCVVRNASKLPFPEHPNLTVAVGNVFNAKDLEPSFQGRDVIVSTLGFPKKDTKPTEFTESMKAILLAMENVNVKRMITISAWFTNPSNRDSHPLYTNMWSKVPGLTNTLDNEGEMEQLLIESPEQKIHFTSVRASSLTWDEVTNKPFRTSEGNWVDDVEGGGWFISRADVARFMLDVVRERDDVKWTRKCVAIAVPMSEEEKKESGARMKAHIERYVKGDLSTH